MTETYAGRREGSWLIQNVIFGGDRMKDVWVYVDQIRLTKKEGLVSTLNAKEPGLTDVIASYGGIPRPGGMRDQHG